MKKSTLLNRINLAMLFLPQAIMAFSLPLTNILKTSNYISCNVSEAIFTENKGQVSDQNYKPRTDILFSGQANGMVYHLKANGISYQLYKPIDKKNAPNTDHTLESMLPGTNSIYRLDVNWLGTNNNPKITTDAAIDGYNNYFLPVCEKGIFNVRSFSGVTFKNIYNNISLHYYKSDGTIKYDYVVAPFGDYKQIKLQVLGAEKISIQTDGGLMINTPFGSIIEQAPVVYQNNNIIPSAWKLEGNILSFEIAAFDPRFELIIDPATRVWGTFYGGIGNSRGNACITDANGDVYMAGTTDVSGGTAIATSGAHQTIFGGGINKTDAFLVKFSSAGIRQWGTYYGGTENELGNSLAVDNSGNVYLSGVSTSSTGIATPGSHQVNNNGGIFDVFLVKFNSSGVRLWATYYGGSQIDESQGNGACSVDASGNVYLAGQTKSNSGIATPGSHQPSISVGTLYDAFLVKFNSNGVRQWGTYYGTSFDDDMQRSCTVDTNGDVYLAGETGSPVNISTVGSHQQSHGGGAKDGYLVKFNSSGVRLWGTFYGGTGEDKVNACGTDAIGNVYIIGESTSSNAISTNGSHQMNNAGGANDAFLAKFNSSGVRQWGTYLGGSGTDRGLGCAIDALGNCIIVGSTNSNSGIATIGSHQVVYGGGFTDAYMAKFSTNGIQIWAHYYGGSGEETSASCAIDPMGAIYMTGRSGSTNSGTLIATPGSHQSLLAGTFDGFLAKFIDCVPPIPPTNLTSASNSTLCNSNTTTLSATSADSIFWFNSSSSTISIASGSILVTPLLNSGIHTFYAQSSNTCAVSPMVPVTVTVIPLIALNSGSICSGNSFTLNPTGALTYTFSSGGPIVNPDTTTTYTVGGTDASGCAGIAIANVTVVPTPSIIANTSHSIICRGNSATLTVSGNGATTFTWNNGSFTNSIIVTPTITTTYSVSGANSSNCLNNTSITQSVSACTNINENLQLNSNISIVPNPNNGLFTLKSSHVICKGTFKIINTTGQILASFEIVNDDETINISQLSAGLYFGYFESLNGETSSIVKIVKE